VFASAKSKPAKDLVAELSGLLGKQADDHQSTNRGFKNALIKINEALQMREPWKTYIFSELFGRTIVPVPVEQSLLLSQLGIHAESKGEGKGEKKDNELNGLFSQLTIDTTDSSTTVDTTPNLN
jgi:hypothetical protein